MQPPRLESEALLARAVAEPEFVLFERGPPSPEGVAAFAAYAGFHGAHPNVPTGWIDVVEQPELAARAAAAAGLTETTTPRVLLLREGRVAWQASGADVTWKAIETALGMPSGFGGG